jgi:type IV pilus assembly protein PilB
MEEKLLKLLYDEQVITQKQYQQVIQECEQSSASPEIVLEQLGILSEETLVEFLSKKFRMPIIDWNAYMFDRELLQFVPESIAVKYTVFPYALERAKRGGKMTLAVADPSDVSAIDDIAFRTGCTIRPAVSSARAIRQAIQKYYREQMAVLGVPGAETQPDRLRTDRFRYKEKFVLTGIEEFDSLLGKLSSSGELAEEEGDVLSTLDQENPATKFLRDLLNTAVERGISEIQIDPYGQEQRVRFRVHGVLHQHTVISDQVGRGIATRLHRIAHRPGSSISPEKEQTPWTGSFSTSQIKGKLLTVSVSFYPTPYGEKVLFKIANMSSPMSLEHLGIGEKSLKILNRVLTKPEGLLLVVSSPGQGKTTTLHAIIQQVARAEMTISMVEDPVETLMPGISHLAVTPQMSCQDRYSLLSYSTPDLIVVENIDTPLMAQLAFELASSTLVLAAFTAFDLADGLGTFLLLIRAALWQAQDTTMRKQRQEIDSLVLDLLNGMVSQRLVRTICPHCKEQMPISGQDAEFIRWLTAEVKSSDDFLMYTGKGCRECLGTGYNGQTGIFEVLKPDKYLKQFLLQDQPISSFQLRRILAGMPIDTLKQQGFQKLREGITSLEEIRRILQQQPAT